MIEIVIITLIMVWIVSFRYKRRRLYELAARIKGPKELPFIGSAHLLTGSNEDLMVSLQNFSYMSIKNKGIMKLWIGHMLYFVIVNPKDLELILKTCLDRDDTHKFLREFIAPNNTRTSVASWKVNRRLRIPSFSTKMIDQSVELFSKKSQKLSMHLEKNDRNGEFSIGPYLSKYSLDTICETVLGIDINIQENPNAPILNLLNTAMKIVSQRILHIWLKPDWLFRMFPQYKDQQKCIKLGHGFIDEVIQVRRQTLREEKIKTSFEQNKHVEPNLKQENCIMDILIELYGGVEKFNNEELRRDILTIISAGTDTTSAAIGYTLKMLSEYQEIQDKVYRELLDVFGDSDEPLEKEHLSQLPYLLRVIKESLRLYPPVPFFIRKIVEETKLPSGTILPSGCGVMVSTWGAHRDVNYWGPDAEKFDPDRFLPERMSPTNTCSYIPFGYGPKLCIGYQYALTSIKTALSTILRKYRVLSVPADPKDAHHIRVEFVLIMKSVDGYKISLERRRK